MDYELSAAAFDLFSGTEQDRRDVLAMHQAYLAANTADLDGAMLKRIWSDHPACVFFNGTGYIYYGLEDWLRLWAYFRPRVKIVDPWKSTDVRLIGDGTTAVVTARRSAQAQWTGDGEAPEWTRNRWTSRSTEVFARRREGWQCVHIHISTEPPGKRHDHRD